MALIVEDGSGLPDADSYASEAEADAYNLTHVASTAWTEAVTNAKEVALRKAANYLDGRFHQRWKGDRYTENQALAWPRIGVIDDDGYTVLETTLPLRVKRAAIEAAIKSLSGELNPDLPNPGSVSKSRKKVGPLEVELEYLGGNSPTPVFPVIVELLAPYLETPGSIDRG